ncbi:MAG: helix-turn-helix transcriptional regulator [Rhizobiaceae bacterium]|nr:MAG: helix-turn-helix transcriptional regulator [Rhizobiaceae bacterium]CAG1008927.1 hypothetical protein RHIZO_03561 [Rhizobiaceae bacterium]
MKAGTDLALIGSLVGDPARANMLAALMGGTALTASELALEAGVTLPTASAHLSKLADGGLTRVTRQGRHRYYRLADHQVAAMLESIMGVASALGPKKVLPGPRDAGMRDARVCYDHLAGTMGVALLDGLCARGIIERKGERLELSARGAPFFAGIGIDVGALREGRRPVCRACLDWSVRRSHLAGSLGAAIYDMAISAKWARREEGGRAIRFTPKGKETFSRLFFAEAT